MCLWEYHPDGDAPGNSGKFITPIYRFCQNRPEPAAAVNSELRSDDASDEDEEEAAAASADLCRVPKVTRATTGQ